MVKQEQRPAQAREPARHRFTVEQYHRLSELGILPPDLRTELLDGVIIDMPAIGEDHLWNVNALTLVFVLQFHTRAVVSIQNPIMIAPSSEPQPDIALLHKPEGIRRKPIPEDVYLLVEVADSSLKSDREVKVPLYAAAGIREVWLINLVERQLEVFRQPVDGSYQHQQTLRAGDTVRPLAFPDTELLVSELLQ